MLSPRNIMIYGALIFAAAYYLLPLYVMVVTSLKGMPEVRLGNIFSPPLEITFEPWVKAWSSACTGLNCDGLSRGFWNSVRITIPSTIVSIAIASINGYALANWRFKGADLFFTILIVGAFIPYQVMIYPIVIVLREMGLYGSLTGLIIVHSIFGMPILTLLFRNYFASLPEELFKAARVDGAGLLDDLFQDHAADVAADLRGRDDPADHRHLERLPVRRRLHPAGILSDDRAAQQYRQFCPGREGIQRQHGGNHPDGCRAVDRLFRLGTAFRPWHRRWRSERVIA
jgi:ABC-type spermidine/putrescine transport system permease subunit II